MRLRLPLGKSPPKRPGELLIFAEALSDPTLLLTFALIGFTAQLIDPTNVAYTVSGGFRGIELAFTSETDPWQGTGRLKRVR